jgi:translation initiation factor IF-1
MPPKKKGQRNVITEDKKRDLVLKEDMEEYGKIDKMLGDGRFNVILCTGESMVSILAKRFRRKSKKGGRNPGEKVFIGSGDVVLVAFRSFENKCDIIYKYEKNEVARLVNMSELPSNFSTTMDTDEKNDIYDGFDLEADAGLEDVDVVSRQTRNVDMPGSESDVSLDFDFDMI